MKKFFASGIAAALCFAALSSSAFAADITEDRSIYAENGQSIAQTLGSWDLERQKVLPDPKAIIPLYKASLYDYAKTGNFEITPWMNTEEDQWYMCDAIDEDGNFVGTLDLIFGGEETGFASFCPASVNNIEPLAFENYAERIGAKIKARGLSTDCKEVRLVAVEDLGYVYYIDNGSEKILAITGIGYGNARVFDENSGRIVVIGDREFAEYAKAELAEYERILEENRKYYEENPDVENPLEGGGGQPEISDVPLPAGGGNDNPATGAEQSETERRMVVLKVELAAMAASAVGIAVISRKRKRGDRE